MDVNGGTFMDINDEDDAGCGPTAQETSQSVPPDNGGDETTNILPEVSEKIREAVIGKSWKTMEEAEQFYHGFALWRGFSVRKDKAYRSTNGEITRRVWTCTRSGTKRTSLRKTPWDNNNRRATTKCDCPAFMRASVCRETGWWKVTGFCDEHNHVMTPMSQQRFVSQYRVVTPEHIEAAQLLRKAGVRVSQIYMYFAARSDGIQNVGFMPKDLYNELDRDGNGIVKGGDSDAAINYMAAQQLTDPDFFYTFKRDDENSLSHILWFDGQSRMDYACFGDVLIFDATYKTNAYGMPLVILAGFSNHHITVPFAFALVHDETTSTYEWILRQFLESMSNRAPKSVVTDNDKAMGRAVESVFGGSVTYRLCGWHVLENAKKYIHSTGFAKEMSHCIYGDMTRDEFEAEWEKMKRKHNLYNHRWAKELYGQRHLWARAYLRGSFLGLVQTTQRIEGLNARVKIGAAGSMKIWELVLYLDSMVKNARDLQDHAEFTSKTSQEDLPRIYRRFHQHARSFYTPESMKKVSDQLALSVELAVHSHVQEDGYYVVRHPESGLDQWRVNYTKDPPDFYCECQHLQSTGFPCRHILKVMREEQIFELPKQLIMKRWTKFARDIENETAPVGSRLTSKECRSLRLTAKFKEAVMEANDDVDASQLILMALSNVIDKIRKQRVEETNYRHARNPKLSTKCMKKKKKNKKKMRGKAAFTRKGANEGTVHTPDDDAAEPSDVPETDQPDTAPHETHNSTQPDTVVCETQNSTKTAYDVPGTSQAQPPNNYVTWNILQALWGDIAPSNSKDAIWNY